MLFLLLYKVLPNANQGWRDVLPGTLVSVVLFFLILQLFPLYMALFPPNEAYAVFGVFLVFTFFLFLLGFVFVIGAELNAFIQEPARLAALAEATKKAHQGQAQFNEQTGPRWWPKQPATRPLCAAGGPLGAPKRSPRAAGPRAGWRHRGAQPAQDPQPQRASGGLAGPPAGVRWPVARDRAVEEPREGPARVQLAR